MNILSLWPFGRKRPSSLESWIERRARRLAQLHGLVFDEALRQLIEAHEWRYRVRDQIEETDK